MVNTNKLKGKIIGAGYNLTTFAEALGVSQATLSDKLRGEGYFNTMQIEKIVSLLGITIQDIPGYFFADNVSEMATLGE